MKLPDRVNKWVDYAKEIWQHFNKNNGFLVAAAISFYDFLAFFPLLLAAIGILGLIIGPKHAQNVLTSSTSNYLVGLQSSKLISNVVSGSSAATGVGIILLLWSGSTAIVVLEQAMNIAWETRQRRSFLKQRLVSLYVLVVVGILMALSVGITAGINAMHNFSTLPNATWFWSLVGYVAPIIVTIALFTFIYKILPVTQVRWKTALIGGTFAGILFVIAEQAFTWYVISFATYNKVYGSIGAVILLLVWINYTTIITLLGAEFALVWAKKHPPVPEQETPKENL